MNSLAARQLRLIDVAPGPPLAGLERRDHRVARVVEMLRGVAARRAVAAADVTAGQAEAEVDPGRTQSSGTLHTPSPGRNRVEIDHVLTTHDGTLHAVGLRSCPVQLLFP